MIGFVLIIVTISCLSFEQKSKLSFSKPSIISNNSSEVVGVLLSFMSLKTMSNDLTSLLALFKTHLRFTFLRFFADE